MKTISGFRGSMRMRPMVPLSPSPMDVHVLPASIDLNTPPPYDVLWRWFASPVPAQTTFGFDGAIAMSPIDRLGCASNTGAQVVPLLAVFHTPPVAAPAWITGGWDSTASTSSIRPPMLTGPTARHENSDRRPASVDSCACARANSPPATMMMRAIGLSLNIARDVRAAGGALSRDAPRRNAECGVRIAE